LLTKGADSIILERLNK
jgi:magnesium-transporting ATPase (P-type)